MSPIENQYYFWLKVGYGISKREVRLDSKIYRERMVHYRKCATYSRKEFYSLQERANLLSVLGNERIIGCKSITTIAENVIFNSEDVAQPNEPFAHPSEKLRSYKEENQYKGFLFHGLLSTPYLAPNYIYGPRVFVVCHVSGILIFICDNCWGNRGSYSTDTDEVNTHT